MKMILKEYEDKDGCKGRGFVQEISKIDEDIQRSMVKFIIESFKYNILSKDMMKMHLD